MFQGDGVSLLLRKPVVKKVFMRRLPLGRIAADGPIQIDLGNWDATCCSSVHSSVWNSFHTPPHCWGGCSVVWSGV